MPTPMKAQTPVAPDEPKYTAEVQPNAPPEVPDAVSEPPKQEEGGSEIVPTQEQAKAEEGEPEATQEELAAAATKISAVYKGNKARSKVNEMKEKRDS